MNHRNNGLPNERPESYDPGRDDLLAHCITARGEVPLFQRPKDWAF